METEKRKAFIINFLYLALMVATAFLVLKYALPLLAPFVIGFIIAYILRKPIRFLSEKLRLNRKLVAVVIVLVFYCTIGVMITLLGMKAFSATKDLVLDLPAIYNARFEPMLIGMFNNMEESILRMDDSLIATLDELSGQMLQSLGQMVSGLSVGVMGMISGFASSLPILFIKLLLMVISTFFIAVDYDRLTGFMLRQLSGKSGQIFMQVKEYVGGTLFACIRSYGLIMSITFLELSIGLTLIGVENSVLIAFAIAIFDILPVLGTGGIMVPWTIITALQGNYPTALALLLIYLFVTVVRNILEPKIVGSRIGLHPVVTLASMFVGVQLFGVLGLFGFPICLSLLRHLNDNGTIHIFKS